MFNNTTLAETYSEYLNVSRELKETKITINDDTNIKNIKKITKFGFFNIKMYSQIFQVTYNSIQQYKPAIIGFTILFINLAFVIIGNIMYYFNAIAEKTLISLLDISNYTVLIGFIMFLLGYFQWLNNQNGINNLLNKIINIIHKNIQAIKIEKNKNTLNI